MKQEKLLKKMIDSMSKASAHKEKGVAGIAYVIPFVCSLFLIGILIMSFTLTGSALQNSGSLDNTSKGIIQNTTSSFAGLVAYFPLWITILGVLVLIGLIALMVLFLRGSGLMGGGPGGA